MTVHSDIRSVFGFPDVLFSTTASRYQVHHILRSTIGVTGRGGCLRRGYHSAGLTSWSAIGFAFSKGFIIDRIWLQSSPHKMIFEAFWSSEGHDWFLLEDCAKLI